MRPSKIVIKWALLQHPKLKNASLHLILFNKIYALMHLMAHSAFLWFISFSNDNFNRNCLRMPTCCVYVQCEHNAHKIRTSHATASKPSKWTKLISYNFFVPFISTSSEQIILIFLSCWSTSGKNGWMTFSKIENRILWFLNACNAIVYCW